MRKYFLYIGIVLMLHACSGNQSKQFVLLQPETTGLNFTNELKSTQDFNMFKYMYFYNGAGCAAADFNNDGLTDLFFASNQGSNRIYLNEGKLHFKDITQQAGIPDDGGWSTGVSIADVNNDGWNDIYICRVDSFEILKGRNQLLICKGLNAQGIPTYKESAAEYGIDFSGFSTQAAFFDYDLDGDLDLFLLNHSVHQNGTFAERKQFIGTYHPKSGDRMYRNDGKKYTDVTRETQINSSAIGYGLGICIADINLDGWPDIYIGNDFHENDYLYINQRNGTFKEELSEHIQHTSQFSMGVDVADINNDAHPEIISMDMLPSDPYILKRSLGEDEYNTFKMKIGYGYGQQFTRNNLQLNRGNGSFSEIGLYSGVAATDWSWSSLFMDFDNDGLKDLFISNGIPKRLNDIDYVNYISNEELQKKIDANNMDEKEMAVIDKFPQIKLPNKFYHNIGDAQFEDWQDQIGNDQPTFSNGTVYADFDNDGDLDIVVNNIDDPVMLYENRQNIQHPEMHWMQLDLKGPAVNPHAVGAKLIVYKKDSVSTYEKFPVRGFLSSMEIPLQAGLGNSQPDSCLLIWPDNSFEKIAPVLNKKQVIRYRKGLPIFDYMRLQNVHANPLPLMQESSAALGLNYLHTENPFNEFDRELLIPHMTSREGPALAVADINGDGYDDVFVGSSKGGKAAVFIQQTNGRFQRTFQPEIELDSTYEETDAVFADVNKDGQPDLIIADGGNEYYGNSEYLLPRVFINDGKGQFIKKASAFKDVYVNASCVALHDINGDGYNDLFIGARTVPFQYGATPQSYLLINNGDGSFTDRTTTYSKTLQNAGMVTGAVWSDMNQDGKKDLVVSMEWGPVTIFLLQNNQLIQKPVANQNGWWNFVKTTDIDNDGDLDIIAGNLGWNSRLKASDDRPLRLYYNDFDDNETKEQLLSYYVQGKEIPFANKDELQKQLPVLKKKFLYAENLAKADMEDIVGKEKMKSSQLYTANELSSMLYINEGNMQFKAVTLPWQAQLSSLKDVLFTDLNQDLLTDMVLVGNYYENNIEMGRYDADQGTVLLNRKNGKWDAYGLNGIVIKGEARKIAPLQLQSKQPAFILTQNNDSIRVVTLP